MAVIRAGSSQFPFHITDIAALLRLNIRRRGPDFLYVDCPLCGDHRGKLYLKTSRDVWHCNYCQESGGMLALYAKVYGISNADAYREICEALQTGDYAPEYRMLLHDTFERLPNVKVMLLEPFALKASATAEIWDTFESEVLLRAEAVKRLSNEFNLTFIPLQEKLREACTLQPASYWLADGVHPTPAGYQLIADAWLEAFAKI